MGSQIKIQQQAELDPFSVNAKSSVKIKKNSKGINYEIKVVTGELDLIEGVTLKAIDAYKKIENDLIKFQRKKDKDDGSNVSLSGNPKQSQGKNIKDEPMPVSADNHAGNNLNIKKEVK